MLKLSINDYLNIFHVYLAYLSVVIWRGLFTAWSQNLERQLSELCPHFVRACTLLILWH